jgi:hypothetical protein
LLEIEPGDRDDPMRCKFRVVDLRDTPQYDAMSYVWGDEGRIIPVHCNGVEILVTPNLADALRRFRPLPKRRELHHLSNGHPLQWIFGYLDAAHLSIISLSNNEGNASGNTLAHLDFNSEPKILRLKGFGADTNSYAY